MRLNELKKKAVVLLYLIYAFWVGMAIFASYDLISDFQYHAPWLHIMIESTMLMGCILSAVIIFKGFAVISKDALGYFESKVQTTAKEAEKWQLEHERIMRGLSQRIQLQFEAWQLSSSEIDIGFLLIKGYGLQKIADIRNTSERTVREQARRIYGKAQVGSRSELAAFFLEDLLPPMYVGPE